MQILGAVLALLASLASLAMEYLRRNPKDETTAHEKALKRRARITDAKHKMAEALGRGDSHEIKKRLDAILDELNTLRMRSEKPPRNPD